MINYLDHASNSPSMVSKFAKENGQNAMLPYIPWNRISYQSPQVRQSHQSIFSKPINITKKSSNNRYAGLTSQ